MARWTSYVEGPRWAGFEDFLIQSTIDAGLTLVSLNKTGGFLRKTYYFTIEGDAKMLQVFQIYLRRAMQQYNGGA